MKIENAPTEFRPFRLVIETPEDFFALKRIAQFAWEESSSGSTVEQAADELRTLLNEYGSSLEG